MKKQMLMLTAALLVISSLWATKKTNWLGGPEVSSKNKVVSTQFKSLVGAERLAEFKQLEKLVLVNYGIFNQPDKMGFQPSTKDDITNLFGTADEVISDGKFWQYNLKTNTSQCKVVFGFNKTAQVIFYAIKDCQ